MDTDAHEFNANHLSVSICVNPWLKIGFSATCWSRRGYSLRLKKSAAALYPRNQDECRRNPWISSGRISCSK